MGPLSLLANSLGYCRLVGAVQRGPWCCGCRGGGGAMTVAVAVATAVTVAVPVAVAARGGENLNVT